MHLHLSLLVLGVPSSIIVVQVMLLDSDMISEMDQGTVLVTTVNVSQLLSETTIIVTSRR